MPKRPAKTDNGASLGFEAQLWAAADKLRANMDAAEYKHVVLGLILLNYISRAPAERHTAWRLAGVNVAMRGIGAQIVDGLD